MDRVQKLAAASIAVGLIVLGLKYAAYHLTGSIALYSDALESVINIVTAVAALIAIRTSAKPADSNHPYGHHKAEYFSAVLTGVLIFVASLSILREAYFGFSTPDNWTRLSRGSSSTALRARSMPPGAGCLSGRAGNFARPHWSPMAVTS
jgi:cation diffusion facilitator family transporter